MALREYLQLSLTSGLGPILIRRIIEHAGSVQQAVTMGRRELEQIEGIGRAKASAIAESLSQAQRDVDAQLARAAELGATLLCPEDAAYPQLLQEIHDPPVVLYLLGALEPRDLQSVAIVGSRRCSYYGREQAERFAALLAGSGVTVVSGGARGIDSAAHRGALAHPQGRTIAVIGSGLDVPYPRENEALFKQIAERGAVLSEFPFGTPPNAENFPRRNRIVSGMSRGVLVIEADLRSGALITARLANEDHGRTVFALPGRVDNQMSAGPHQLIRDGATLVTCLEDIVGALDPLPDSTREPQLFEWEGLDEDEGGVVEAAMREAALKEEDAAGSAPAARPAADSPGLSRSEQRLLAEMDQPASVDELIERTGLEAAEILQCLTLMSLKGRVKRVDGQTYVKAGVGR